MLTLNIIKDKFPSLVRSYPDLLTNIINTDEIVFIEGQSGSGKSFLAECIHRDSIRKHRVCSKISLAALPSSLFESELFGHVKGAFTGADRGRIGLLEYSDGGTVVLEDITELNLDNQAKFLQFLDEKAIRKIGENTLKPIDIRLILTTNRDIIPYIISGRFRRDLYYRLSTGFTIKTHSIDMWSQDEIRQFLDKAISSTKRKYPELFANWSTQNTFNTTLIDTLQEREIGNIRGLIKIANYLTFLNKNNFTQFDLPEEHQQIQIISKEGTISSVLNPVLQDLIETTLVKMNHNQVKTARKLGISRNRLRNRMKEFDILK